MIAMRNHGADTGECHPGRSKTQCSAVAGRARVNHGQFVQSRRSGGVRTKAALWEI